MGEFWPLFHYIRSIFILTVLYLCMMLETPRDLQGFDRGIHECHVMILLPYLSLYHSSVHVYLDLKASRWGGASFQRGECQKGFRAEKRSKKVKKGPKRGGGGGG